jgi:RNA polymerase sigma-70 factor (ECF subfamily)
MEAVMTWGKPGQSSAAGAALSGAAQPGHNRFGSASPSSWHDSFSGLMSLKRARALDPDTQLVERCLAGEDLAWEELVRTHTRRVYGICYRFTGSDTEAQDLTQDVFLRLFRAMSSFRPKDGAFTVWLTRMTRNLLIDHYRKSRLQRATDSIEDQLAVLEERGSATTRADAMLAGREAGELIQQALGKLSPELRETVILRDLEEMEYREIADVLAIPEGTVKSRLNRGRAELARLLRRQKVTA